MGRPEDADPSNDEEDIGDENEALPLSAHILANSPGSPGATQDKKRSRQLKINNMFQVNSNAQNVSENVKDGAGDNDNQQKQLNMLKL